MFIQEKEKKMKRWTPKKLTFPEASSWEVCVQEKRKNFGQPIIHKENKQKQQQQKKKYKQNFCQCTFSICSAALVSGF